MIWKRSPRAKARRPGGDQYHWPLRRLSATPEPELAASALSCEFQALKAAGEMSGDRAARDDGGETEEWAERRRRKRRACWVMGSQREIRFWGSGMGASGGGGGGFGRGKRQFQTVQSASSEPNRHTQKTQIHQSNINTRFLLSSGSRGSAGDSASGHMTKSQ